jgi:nucleoid-associated protein YgaU
VNKLLKSLLKVFKLNESSISTILGILVIAVVGVLVINYFRNLDSGSTLPSGVSNGQSLPTTHTVERGETLWSISEKYYEIGYNWVDIMEKNNLTSPDDIAEGQALTIPDVEPRSGEAMAEATPEASETPSPTPTTQEPTMEPAPTTKGGLTTSSSSYTVVAGDTLWDIAEAHYGSGYKWIDIARANELANPNLIHPGNVFVLP